MKFNHILTLSIVSLLGACGGSSGGSSTAQDTCDKLASSTFSCDDLLRDVVSEGVLPVVQTFSTKLSELDTKVATYCDDIADDVKLAAARTAWSDVMEPLQQFQVMNFGPNSDEEVGLLPFYDWQTASPFDIDIAIAKSARFSDTGLSSSDNEKDLVTIEYVLFDVAAVQTYDNPEFENSNVKEWRTGKTDDQIQQDRCTYAKLATAALASQGTALVAAWNEFDFVAASSNKQDSANEIAKSLFYLDKITKDVKIKAVLPQPDDSTSGFRAEKLESQFAHQSKEAIENNLRGALLLLNLNDSDNSKTALDDYLVAAGQTEVAVAMQGALIDAIANVIAIEGDLYTAVEDAMNETEIATNETQCKAVAGTGTYVSDTSDIETFCALQYQVKTLTDILKGDFTLLTSFTIPATASGDND